MLACVYLLEVEAERRALRRWKKEGGVEEELMDSMGAEEGSEGPDDDPKVIRLAIWEGF